MQSISTYKDRALENLKGNWGTAAIVTLVYFLIYEGINWLVGSFLSTASGAIFQLVWMAACLPLMWSYMALFLDFTRGGSLEVGKLFAGYSDFGRVFGAYFLYMLVVIIGCICFIVPGIILALMFSQFIFIQKDDPTIGAIDSLKKSAEIMKGHKWELFVLLLSFIGWAILAILTLGIGLLFLEPYMMSTCAHYYEDLKKEQEGL